MCLQCDLSKVYLLKDGKKLKFTTRGLRESFMSFLVNAGTRHVSAIFE